MSEELDWARDLFDRARGGGEPAWTADPKALARAGDRRRRLRMAGAGGGLAGVVAVTAAVAVGLGAGTTDAGSQPGPGGAWGNKPLSDVFKYTSFRGGDGDSAGRYDSAGGYIAAPAAADLAAVMGRLDPSLTHLAGYSGKAPGLRIVAAGDAHAKAVKVLDLGSVWTTGALRQSGELTFAFASSTGWAQTMAPSEPGVGQLTAPCNVALGGGHAPAAAQSTSAQFPSKVTATWSACSVSHLQDGSTIGSATARLGTGSAVVALREFADGEVFSVVAQNFPSAPTWQGMAPDPATVVQPMPWSEQSLVAALTDPAVRPGWNPFPPQNSDGKLLLPTDLGKDWSFDTSQAADGGTGQFVIINGCGEDQRVPLAQAGSEAHYRGPLPNGVSGTAYEGEYRLRPGAGPQTMARARSGAQGGCKPGAVDYSKDTVMALPAGIGDDAFAASVPGLGMVSIDVRVGDTILKTDLSDSNSVRDQTWTDHEPLDLSSPADQQWLAAIARSMVSRYTAGATHH